MSLARAVLPCCPWWPLAGTSSCSGKIKTVGSNNAFSLTDVVKWNGSEVDLSVETQFRNWLNLKTKKSSSWNQLCVNNWWEQQSRASWCPGTVSVSEYVAWAEIYPPAPGSFNVGISRCFQLSEISWGEIFLTMGLWTIFDNLMTKYFSYRTQMF